MREHSITSLAKFQEQLQELEYEEENFFYRGQVESDWPVSCAAARRLALVPEDPQEVRSGNSNILVGYMEFLIAKARLRGYLPPGFREDSPSLELLAQLQHQGAATGLIDFTRQPMVALWFACGKPHSNDGAVYVLPRSATQVLNSRRDLAKEIRSLYQDDIMWSWEPSVVGSRIVAQSSVFILGIPVIESDRMLKLTVRQNCKGEILAQLEAVYGINEEVLFSDFPGYAVANAPDKSFDNRHTISYWLEQIEVADDDDAKAKAHLDCGLALEGIGEVELAREQYETARSIIERN